MGEQPRARESPQDFAGSRNTRLPMRRGGGTRARGESGDSLGLVIKAQMRLPLRKQLEAVLAFEGFCVRDRQNINAGLATFALHGIHHGAGAIF